ncbi:M56 family metallopeptidase [Snuella lapsa]|uniref:Peptidase M56 domain-containing protein n=1 Tax=Snuella lapsa TaxID=870481 RepID=A0ABP6WN36_9FLAO
MILYALKSGICLGILYALYKLFLEKEDMHHFKRFYLIGALLASIIIPAITFTEYIEVIPEEIPLVVSNNVPLQIEVVAPQQNYWPVILWSIYGLGLLLFSIKFIKNLLDIGYKIRQNPKYKTHRVTNVLLAETVIPHTFLSYIFLNKRKFESQQIPKAILLHEEAHAIQKHSLDVLFIEIVLIAFWFNPLVYLIKQSMKLNHEFLADQTVINKGIATPTYQNILLAFSSNASYSPLAHAINHSLIKKRFTVMKTQTSKLALWLRRLLVLPLLTILIYSFSSKVIVEKNLSPQATEQGASDDKITIHIDKNNTISINNKQILLKDLSNELKMIIHQSNATPNVYVEVKGTLSNAFLFDLKKEVEKANTSITEVKANYIEMDERSEHANSFKGISFTTTDSIHFTTKKGEFIRGYSGSPHTKSPQKATDKEDHDSITIRIPKSSNYIINSNDLMLISKYTNDLIQNSQQKATDKEITEYKQFVKKLNALPERQRIIKQKDLVRLQHIYNKMSEAQKRSVTPFYQLVLPPPPPPPTPAEPQNPSKTLLDARKKYEEKAETYMEAVQGYKTGESKFDELHNLYKEVMLLYKQYSSLSKSENIAYNYLTVPDGGKFELKLSDGTKVFLGSGAKLKYPAKFVKGQTRKVELIKGEAYFDVAKSDEYANASFIVIVNGKEIDASRKKSIKN